MTLSWAGGYQETSAETTEPHSYNDSLVASKVLGLAAGCRIWNGLARKPTFRIIRLELWDGTEYVYAPNSGMQPRTGPKFSHNVRDAYRRTTSVRVSRVHNETTQTVAQNQLATPTHHILEESEPKFNHKDVKDRSWPSR